MELKRQPDRKEIGYGGDPAIALYEGWVRERSFALESILKAVIAQRAETLGSPEPPKATHNVSDLWDKARLPSLDKDDRARLVLTWQALQWSGRYAAPNRGSDGQRKAVAQLTAVKKGGLLVHSEPTFGWDEFDHLYRMAATEMFKLYEERWPDI